MKTIVALMIMWVYLGGISGYLDAGGNRWESAFWPIVFGENVGRWVFEHKVEELGLNAP